ncbi:hypothetical protein Q1695_009300 [Nippostrongylus brasiliensis]|nr:hypothetical protein Q1695_009300 [Nippostrongylus brasiliensis]
MLGEVSQCTASAPRYRRLCFMACAASLFIGLVAAVVGLSYFDHQHNNIIHEYVARQDDVAILSATYYSQSRSFPNNTVVLLLNAHQVLHLKHSELYGISTNASGPMKTSFRIYPVVQQIPFYCKWVPFIAVGQVSEQITSLQLSTGERGMTVYSYFGASMHFYVRSMIADLFAMLSRYPNVRIEPWPGVSLGSKRATSNSFDPNIELEFRNQASAMTDCLLMYKESAKFIIFPDTDDVIIPRLGRTYLEEFEKVFNVYPDAAVIAYNMSQSAITTTTSPSTYSPVDILKSLQFKGETRWGKLVVRPERTDSAWIHRSYGIREGFKQVTLPIELNSALHLRFWSFVNQSRLSDDILPSYNPLLKNLSGPALVDRTDLEKIHRNFMARAHEMSNVYDGLPVVSIYYPLIEQCYNRIFYNGEQHSKCKGPELCDLPQFPGVRCVNVQSQYETFDAYDRIFLHRLVTSRFEHSNLGCLV